jgi:hypothetical protein
MRMTIVYRRNSWPAMISVRVFLLATIRVRTRAVMRAINVPPNSVTHRTAYQNV